MSYTCYKCENDFDEIAEAFKHLKDCHQLRNNQEKIKCLVKNSNCKKSFMNFDSLRQHMKVCVLNVQILQVSQTNSIHYCIFEKHRNIVIAVFINNSHQRRKMKQISTMISTQVH